MEAVPKKMFGGASLGTFCIGWPMGQSAASGAGVGVRAGIVAVASGVPVAVGANVKVGATVAVGIGVRVGGTEVAPFGSVVAAGSSDPPQPITANMVTTIARAKSNLTIICVLISKTMCRNISQQRRLRDQLISRVNNPV